MGRNHNIFIEETENSKFAVIEFESLSQLIHYQVQMITNNDIRFLLKCSIQQMNGMIRLYYDITKRMSLREYRDKFGFSSEKFTEIIKSLVEVDTEIDEYQLVNSGILFDPQWTFVDKNGENVKYIYIPDAKEEKDASDIKRFIANMLQNGYANTNDQLLTANLFMLVQDSNSSLRDLRDLIYKMEGRDNIPSLRRKPVSNSDFSSDAGIDYNQEINKEAFNERMNKPSVPDKGSFAKKPSVPAINSIKPKNSKFSFGGKNKKSSAAEKEAVTTTESANIVTDKPEIEQKSTLPRTLFILGNVVAVAIIIKLYMSGIFNMDNGALDITKLGALAVAVIAIDAIAVKNLFLSKGEPKPKKEKTPKVKKVKEPKVKKEKPNVFNAPKAEIPVSTAKEMPVKEEPVIERKPIPDMNAFNIQEKRPEINMVNEKPVSPIVPSIKEFEIPKQNEKPLISGNDIESEETVLMSGFDASDVFGDETVLMEDNSPKGFIERIENGEVADKYVIKKDRIIIGRLRSQVDMIDLNTKVSKLHAEINFKDNKFYIKDLGSKNGTYLNNSDERIEKGKDIEIKDNEKFKLADSDYCIHFLF